MHSASFSLLYEPTLFHNSTLSLLPIELFFFSVIILYLCCFVKSYVQCLDAARHNLQFLG